MNENLDKLNLPAVRTTPKITYSTEFRKLLEEPDYLYIKDEIRILIEMIENNENHSNNRIGTDSGFGEVFELKSNEGYVLKVSKKRSDFALQHKGIQNNLNRNLVTFEMKDDFIPGGVPIKDVRASTLLNPILKENFGEKITMVSTLISYEGENNIYSVMPKIEKHEVIGFIPTILKDKNRVSNELKKYLLACEFIFMKHYFLRISKLAGLHGLFLLDFKPRNIALLIPDVLPDLNDSQAIEESMKIVIFDIVLFISQIKF